MNLLDRGRTLGTDCPRLLKGYACGVEADRAKGDPTFLGPSLKREKGTLRGAQPGLDHYKKLIQRKATGQNKISLAKLPVFLLFNRIPLPRNISRSISL